MTWITLIQRTILLSLTGPGLVGNIIMFVMYIHTFVTGHEKKPTDLILIHLAFSHTIMICSIGIRGVAAAFYFRNFLGNTGCKIVVYMGRVARGFSICNTCLLSMVQAITISPRTTLWRKHKPQTAWQVLPCLLLLWIFNFLISSNLLNYITSASRMNRTGIEMYIGHCYMMPSRQTVRWLFLFLMTLRDIVFQSLMGQSSGYMAVRLYEHHKRVLYLHNSRSPNNFSPEIRATQSILILTACFLFFYWADFIFSFYIGFNLTHTSTILYIKIFLLLGYVVLSPFVLMSRNTRVA
ncbi:putative vomeronasal receptor-like protein 4 [Octodon degus]|uniref:Vomeronasal type-1 receptor n=1 Tax=Octodon degus TaxID=10160 RepID=A0A6P3F1Q6_OCTDE|nr:putative vomeronasal receptor-like protein 4 [Octodon degus]